MIVKQIPLVNTLVNLIENSMENTHIDVGVERVKTVFFGMHSGLNELVQSTQIKLFTSVKESGGYQSQFSEK